jgi:hypothetical protein
MIGIVLLIIFFIFRSPQTSTKSNIIIPSITPVITQQPSSRNPEFDDYKKNRTDGFGDTNIPATSPIKNVHFENLGKTVPVFIPEDYDPNISPSKYYKAQLTNTSLLIYFKDSNSLQKKVTLKFTTNKSSVVWITDDILLLIEKDPEEPHIDYFYAIDRKSGEKTYLIGSFMIPSRLNMNFNPFVYNNSHSVLLKDNEANYWQLNVLY